MPCGRLANNFKGYDISPDMVRLSLANMYLHGFQEPHIYEYDTLTSEDRWNEYADVILANPPFMSPKGGIKPHNRFSVQSKRSEVLFVDYMAEHLTANGRAGIIVPEGIIFQSQTAYRQLRRMLVEDYLVAVVSLPAGVFNPYSGVKTSILILDRALAKRTDSIGFFKVENDGLDLGAQRRPLDRNDLPKVQAELGAYLGRLRVGESVDDFQATFGFIVGKERVPADGEYNLSGERYWEPRTGTSTWPVVAVKELFKRSEETVLPETLLGPANYVGLANITSNTGQLCGHVVVNDPTEVRSLKNVFCKNDILYGRLRPNLNKVWLADRDGFCSTDIIVVRPTKEATVLPELYSHLFRSVGFNAAVLRRITGAQLPRISWTQFQALTVPLPPLEVQREIVAELEGYQKVIDGARVVVEHYQPHIVVDPEWPMVALGDVCNFKRGPFGGSLKKETFVQKGYAVYEQSHAISENFRSFRYFIDESKYQELKGFAVHPKDIIMSCSGTMGRTAIVPDGAPPGIINQALLKLQAKDQLLTPFLKSWMDSPEFQLSIENVAFGAAIRNVASVKTLKGLRIPLPPLVTQEAIVAELDSERALVEANQELIQRFENKIETTVTRVWGSVLSPATDD